MSRERKGGKHLKQTPKTDWRRSLRRWWRYNWHHRRKTVIALITACVLLAIVVGVGIWWNQWAVEPDLPNYPGSGGSKDPINNPVSGQPNPDDPDDFNYIEVDPDMPDYLSNQKKGIYTFLLLGRSDADNYTDMIMLAVFDTNTGDVNIASIPRDLMVNMSRDIKKINSASANGNVSAMMTWVRKTTGIQPNFYVLLDWAAVGQLVNEVGGIYFDVPQRMHYHDPTPKGGFLIDLEPGYQLLDGDKAMQLIRWRKNNEGYTGSPGDGARMEIQQNFMKEAAKQILVPKNLLKLGTFATIFTENVETDLTVGNLVWFAQQALNLDSVNKLSFCSLPGEFVRCWSRSYKHLSDNGGRMQYYYTLYPNQLLKLINDKLNPYEKKITLGDLDLMSCTDGHVLSSTTGRVADTTHEAAYQEWKAVQDGRAYYDDDGNLIYGDPDEEDPDDDNPDGDSEDGEGNDRPSRRPGNGSGSGSGNSSGNSSGSGSGNSQTSDTNNTGDTGDTSNPGGGTDTPNTPGTPDDPDTPDNSGGDTSGEDGGGRRDLETGDNTSGGGEPANEPNSGEPSGPPDWSELLHIS